MRSVQEVGKEILTGSPKPVYILLGEEYGIKKRYIDILTAYYGNRKEIDSFDDLLKSMNVKHLIPLEPCLYVCRYDAAFLDSLDNNTASKINSTNIVGTAILLYESAKSYDKIDKYLSDYCCMIESVDSKFIRKYLSDEFRLPQQLIDFAVASSSNYGQARMVCTSMLHSNHSELCKMDFSELSKFFGLSRVPVEETFKTFICSRNSIALLQLLDTYEGDLNSLYYSILSTLLELEKTISQNNPSSKLYKYIKSWKLEDIYNLFNHTYLELIRSRKIGVDLKLSLMYLFSLIMYSNIPSVESVM